MTTPASNDKKSFYITTTLPYVNALPHIGFAMELIRADIIARYKTIQGFDVFFNTGTDEHGTKIFRKAQEEGKETQVYVDSLSEKYRRLKDDLNISNDVHFIRTTDVQHIAAAQAFWKLVFDRGFIEKKQYSLKYCVGCELEKTDSELENGHCPLHPHLEIEHSSEENYFFKFSAFQKQLLELYEKNKHFVVPESRFNEIKSFVSHGLNDFSISRLKSKMPWGVAVPNDSDHVMYVWFEALVSYISTLGWPHNTEQFKKYWEEGTPTQYCGKDNLRQQAAMWQAMLFAAGLPQSKQIIVNGFVTGEGGVKMSKSLGNVTDPSAVAHDYGADAVRYFVARELTSFEDSPFSLAIFKRAYNDNLANGLGNLVSRLLKMSQSYFEKPIVTTENFLNSRTSEILEEYMDHLNNFEIKKAADLIWKCIGDLDEAIEQKKPYMVFKTNPNEAQRIVEKLIKGTDTVCLIDIARMLEPILPETAEKIKNALLENKMPEPGLFPRKE